MHQVSKNEAKKKTHEKGFEENCHYDENLSSKFISLEGANDFGYGVNGRKRYDRGVSGAVLNDDSKGDKVEYETNYDVGDCEMDGEDVDLDDAINSGRREDIRGEDYNSDFNLCGL